MNESRISHIRIHLTRNTPQRKSFVGLTTSLVCHTVNIAGVLWALSSNFLNNTEIDNSCILYADEINHIDPETELDTLPYNQGCIKPRLI